MQTEALTKPQVPPRERICVEAPPHVRDAVRNILVGHMAAHLRLHQIDLADATVVRSELMQAGFGEPSVTALVARAIEAAR